MKLHDILEIKATIVEVAKDSPLLAYFAFYEPLHTWMSGLAEGWNPFAKFTLNVVMVIYGILRIIAILNTWDNKGKKDEDEGDGNLAGA